MTRPDCPRLARELALLAAMNRTGKGAKKRRARDHARWCGVCSPTVYRVPDGLPRERED